jgi:predicted nucleotidyltransferase component of viral defense system
MPCSPLTEPADVLDPDELHDVASTFGVDEQQVLRDHLISHLLAVISAEAADELVFFGGTALARSVVPDGRLSEDIDLITSGSRLEIARQLTTTLPRSLRREFPGVVWQPPLTEATEPAPAVLHTTDGLAVRIQLLSAAGYPDWPTQRIDLVQRYSDAAPAMLTVPTPAAFAAAKAVAWHHRRASRDLWDLWALAGRGHLDDEAADLYARLGPTNRRPDPVDYADAPLQARWERDLGGQTRLTVTATQAASAVAKAWERS